MLSCQVPCRGKGQSPQPQAVNQAVYEIWSFMSWHPDKFVLVHCTHGFNRTGEAGPAVCTFALFDRMRCMPVGVSDLLRQPALCNYLARTSSLNARAAVCTLQARALAMTSRAVDS